MKRRLACLLLSVVITATTMRVHASEHVVPIAPRTFIPPIPANAPVRKLPSTPVPSNAKRRRRKRHLAWEQAELASNGLYARYLEKIAVSFPVLSPMEQRVCALAKARLPNWKAGELLGICEKTVENHLRSSRMKLGLPPGTRLASVLTSEQEHSASDIELSRL